MPLCAACLGVGGGVRARRSASLRGLLGGLQFVIDGTADPARHGLIVVTRLGERLVVRVQDAFAVGAATLSMRVDTTAELAAIDDQVCRHVSLEGARHDAR
jgi:hypothetical protein